jgi:hypothetical protein
VSDRTLHVTNWASRRLHGPGRRWTIMAAPRRWERGEGCVYTLTPWLADLRDLHACFLSVVRYRDRCIERFREDGKALNWPHLTACPGWDHMKECADEEVRVESGDTLCCACSKADAAVGCCHRVWAAELLRRAGWRVVLDGRELVGVTAEWAPLFVEASDAL